MTSIIEKLTQIMTTTPDEDKQYLNEVIQEIKVKRPRGRPRIYKDYQDCLATVTQYYNDKERLAIKRRERYLRDKEKARLQNI